MKYPTWIKACQNLDKERDENPARTIRNQLMGMGETLSLKRGKRIAVTVGSRGISNLVVMTQTVLEFLSSIGCHPFLVPAMGSHGGGTASGQKKVLEDFGFTEQALNVPIVSSLEVVLLGDVHGIPIFFDKNAYEADGVVVINRVKSHQVFRGDIQSGLNKMQACGLGKKKGAEAIHSSNRTDILGEIGDFIRHRVPIVFGVAILENAYDETKEVAVVRPDQFNDIDKKWLIRSRKLMAKIPIRKLDLLIVDQMGKDISGSGMDTNVIGFTRRLDSLGKVSVPLAVLDLTELSDGNAIGIGLADFTTRKLFDKIDFKKTYTNVIATGIYSSGRIPIVLQNDREILDTFVQRQEKPEQVRIIRIKDTLHLDSFYATESLIGELEWNRDVTLESGHFRTSFDASENLIIK
jgi:hypothetical protein